ncbi:helix-turn-helix transcriptional regulator [Methanolobus halotolerans]|uniref:Transcriptional regulator n=1 Tax=Methanolobus halotolerans TaxID=2052935 RepID=A0A4E0Q5H8_9EURY|nr:winged helix-turn-helix domain-containing protein [Methanolobus halotolerans]TGC09430.1 transcriptional regulator [Methanolobus halotolerans]
MKKPLLDVLFASDKRKNLLLFLKDETKEMEEILSHLRTNRQSLLPQVRILEEHHIVTHESDIYELTIMGRQIVEKMVPLISTVNVLNTSIDYWGTRNLDFIPPHLLKRINELGKCITRQPSLVEMHSIQANFHEASKNSESVFVVTTFLFPNHVQLFKELLENGVNIHFIISPDVLGRLRYEVNPEFEKLLQNDLLNLFVHTGDDMNFLSFGLNDKCLFLRLFTNTGENDSRFTACTSSSALKWGKELFENFRENSTLITEL